MCLGREQRGYSDRSVGLHEANPSGTHARVTEIDTPKSVGRIQSGGEFLHSTDTKGRKKALQEKGTDSDRPLDNIFFSFPPDFHSRFSHEMELAISRDERWTRSEAFICDCGSYITKHGIPQPHHNNTTIITTTTFALIIIAAATHSLAKFSLSPHLYPLSPLGQVGGREGGTGNRPLPTGLLI